MQKCLCSFSVIQFPDDCIWRLTVCINFEWHRVVLGQVFNQPIFDQLPSLIKQDLLLVLICFSDSNI